MVSIRLLLPWHWSAARFLAAQDSLGIAPWGKPLPEQEIMLGGTLSLSTRTRTANVEQRQAAIASTAQRGRPHICPTRRIRPTVRRSRRLYLQGQASPPVS